MSSAKEKLGRVRNGCGKVYVQKLLEFALVNLDVGCPSFIVQLSTTRNSITDWCGYPTTGVSPIGNLHGKLEFIL